jgi:ABC-type cobalamin/Fe3+-siderophores transport system ATPase subunit
VSAEAIRIENLRVRRGRRSVLELDALSIRQGETVTMLGPNGAGKSTLLRCLLGLQSVAGGVVEVLGQDPARRGASLRRRIGYVPQLLPVGGEMPLTVREVVSIGRMGKRGLLRRLTSRDWEIIDHWIGRLGLGGLSDRRYSRLSGGEQRRALIARAMAQEPSLLLLDEPTANLDLQAREHIVRHVDALACSPELTTVLVCHELEVIPPTCHRAVILRGGHLLTDGPVAEVLTDQTVDALYAASLRVVSSRGRWAAVPGGDHA